MATELNAMQDLLSREHFIDRTEASTMVGKFTTHRNRLFKTNKNYCTLPFNSPAIPTCVAYNKDAIIELLNNPGCVAMRLYPAINNAGQLTFVLVGVDETGANILEATNNDPSENNLRIAVRSFVDEGQTCPPYPAPGISL